MAPPPIVLHPLTLPALLHHVLSTDSASTPIYTTLIICSSRETFLQDLVTSVQQHEHHDDHVRNLVTPTLHNLATARRVKAVFCASVPSLLAYLTAHQPIASENFQEDVEEKMILLNPLALCAPTPSYSAQGLSKLFATAVDTAIRVRAALAVAECHKRCGEARTDGEGDVDMDMGDVEPQSDGPNVLDPWEQEVSILNTTSKKFGSGNSDRAWAGRTIKIKWIAARWFLFHSLHVSAGALE